MNDDKHIEDLFRKKFSDYEIQPSDTLWSKVVRNLRLKQFLFFSPGRFNIYYLMLVITLIVLGSLLLFKKIENNSIENYVPIGTGNIIQTDPVKTITGKERNESEKREKAWGNVENVIKKKREMPDNNKNNNVIMEENKGKMSSENNMFQVNKSSAASWSAEDGETENQGSLRQASAENNDSETLINFAIFPKSGCAPLNVRMENYSRMKGTFEWHLGDGGKSDLKNPVYLFDEPGTFEVSLSVFMKDGSVFSAKKTIHVFEKPKAAFEIYHENIISTQQPVVFLNYSNNAEKFLWAFGDGTFSEEISPEHYYEKAGKYDVKLKVWSEYGCVDSTIISNAFEDLGGKIKFPTAFIPNLNGPSNGYYTLGLTTNEVFHPDHDGIEEYHLKIYNRDGILIFESKDVNRGWDGYINGTLAKQGVYVWKARGRFTNGQTFVKFGNVTLIKK